MEMEEPVTQKRKRGEKNPVGETRALILLFIIKNGVSQTDDIRDYLREKGPKRFIKTKNLVYRHIKKLEKDGYIKRLPGGKGKIDSYMANEGFESFKNIFNFLKEHGLEKSLMKSNYYKNYLQNDDFLTKLPFNFFKQNILDLYHRIKDEEKRRQFIEEIKQNPPILPIYDTTIYRDNSPMGIPNLPGPNLPGPKNIELNGPISNLANVKTRSKIKKTINLKNKVIRAINKISQGKGDDPIINAFISLAETLETKTIDEFYDIYRERFGYMSKGQSTPTDMEGHLKYVKGLLVPDGKEQDLIKILMQSPSAIDFVLNSKYYDRFIIRSLIEYYFKPESDEDGSFFNKLFWCGAPENDGLYLEILLELPKENIDVSNVFPGITLLYILRSLIVADIIKGEIENNKDTIDSIRTVLAEGKRE